MMVVEHVACLNRLIQERQDAVTRVCMGQIVQITEEQSRLIEPIQEEIRALRAAKAAIYDQAAMKRVGEMLFPQGRALFNR